MRIVFFGNNRRGAFVLRHLVERGLAPVAVVADPAFAEREDWYAWLGGEAKALGLPLLAPERINTRAFRARIAEWDPELFLLCGYSKIVGRKLLAVPKVGAINLHAGKVPEYRGAAPLNWALIHGEREIGLSVLEVDAGIDTGPILAQARFDVGPDDTIADVVERVGPLYGELLDELLPRIEAAGRLEGIPQDPTEGFWCTKRTREDGRVLWDRQGAEEVHNLVRALTRPYPGAFCRYDGEEVVLLRTRRTPLRYYGVPGRIARRDPESGSVVVIARDRGIEITRCELRGEERRPCEVFHDMGIPVR